MVTFDQGYSNSMDRDYNARNKDLSQDVSPEGLFNISEIGASATEGGRFGPFRQSINAALRAGGRKIELQPQMGGGAEPSGVESYGQQQREELREIARANNVEFTGVHAPSQIGNLSGFQARQGGGGDFSDEYRKLALEEIKKAIDFAADVAQGGAVIIHTGEFQRPMSEAAWSKQGKDKWQFLSYQEEPGRASIPMVDRRNGRVALDVKKSETLREPVYLTAADFRSEGRRVDPRARDYDIVDQNGNILDPDSPEQLFLRVPKWNADFTRFETTERSWDDFEKKAQEYNDRNRERIARGEVRDLKPEDMFIRTRLETQMLQARGSSLFHGKYYETHKKNYEKLSKALEYVQKLEKDLPEEEKWRMAITQSGLSGIDDREISRYVPTETMPVSEFIKEKLQKEAHELKYTREASAAADAQADTTFQQMQNIEPLENYAKKQTFKSYAEAAIHAMDLSQHHKHVKRDIYLAPENIFPEMGYGSHPEELKELVTEARKTMKDYLTAEKIRDPYGRTYTEEQAKKMNKPWEAGNPILIDNPYKRKNLSEQEAQKLAEKHIKATFDIQHLSMWRKHFQPEYNNGAGRMETKLETDERFNKWYLKEVKNLQESGIIGNIHAVDSMGSGHHHLPIGQGVFPTVDALKYLKSKGYEGPITSEAWAEDHISAGRILTQPWRALGSPIYSDMFGSVGGAGGAGVAGSPRRWDDIHQSYFGQNRPPEYVFGSYSPSNDWSLWTQVPLE